MVRFGWLCWHLFDFYPICSDGNFLKKKEKIFAEKDDVFIPNSNLSIVKESKNLLIFYFISFHSDEEVRVMTHHQK